MTEEIVNLNLDELDVEELEHRLELGVVSLMALPPGGCQYWPGCPSYSEW